MKWDRGQSGSGDDVVDAGSGGGVGRRMAIPGGLGVVGVILFLVIQALSGGSGVGGFNVPGQLPAGSDASARTVPAREDTDKDLREFTIFVFRNVQTMWRGVFAQSGRQYKGATLVLYRGGVDTGCGAASSAVGPFYCPADQRVYLDLSFEAQMTNQLDADGDFAWAYVIAHEMGHHVQQQLGTEAQVREAMARNPDDANALSVRLELQADCYAGVWAKGAQERLEPGDIEEGLNAASAVGDDRLQKKARGSIDPDSFTHGTSEQRMRWFQTGYDSGDAGACDTFSAERV